MMRYSKRWSLFRPMVLAALFSLCGFSALAKDGQQRFDYGEVAGVFEEPGSKEGYLNFGVFDRAYEHYADWKSDTALTTGFSWLIEDRQISQWGRDSRIFDNELNLIGRLEFARQSPATWSLNIWGQFANTLGSTTQSEFQNDLGVLSPLNGGNSGPDRANQVLQMMSLEYINPDETLRFQVGKLAVRTLMNLNRYAHGDSDSFFSPMLGNNPVVPYTALLGLGFFGQYRADNWYLSGLVRAPDTELGLSTDAWRAGAREYLVEVAITPTVSRLGYGEYRMTWSRLEDTDSLPQVETFSFSADQDLGERFGGFLRFSRADDTFRDFEMRAAAGLIIKQPFGFQHDRIGFGAWYGKPNDPTLRSEKGVEAFYRAQVSPVLQISSSLQVVFDPAKSVQASETILGLRLRLEL